MTMKIMAIALFASSFGAQADILTLGTSSKKVDGVKIYDTATTNVSGRTVPLTEKAAALRQKTVVVITKDVYVAQLLVADGGAYDTTKTASCPHGTPDASQNELKGLDTQKAVAIRLDFLYPVTASQFDGAFRDSFNANKIDWNTPAITQFLNAVNAGGDVKVGNSWTLVLEKNIDGKDVLSFSGRKRQSQHDHRYEPDDPNHGALDGAVGFG